MRRFFALILMMVFCISALAGCSESNPEFIGQGTAKTTVTLRIVTMDGEKLFDSKVTVVDDNPKVYMALEAAAKSENLDIDISGKDKPETMYLIGIGDLVSVNPNYWMYYINKEKAQLGMGAQPIENKDTIEFLYGDYNMGYVEIK